MNFGKQIDDDYIGVHDSETTSELARSDMRDEDASADEPPEESETDADASANASDSANADASTDGADASQPSDAPRREDRIIRDQKAADHVDDRAGSAAASEIEEVIDEDAIIEHDGRASTRTFFRPADASEEKREQFERLIGWQEDKWSGMKNAQRAADRMRTIGNYCGHLDIAESARKRITVIEESVDMSRMSYYSSDQVILGIVSLVANERGRFIRDEDDYRELLTNVDIDLDDIKTIRSMVKDQSEQYGN